MFKYIAAFFISMVPLIELRLGVPFAIGILGSTGDGERYTDTLTLYDLYK